MSSLSLSSMTRSDYHQRQKENQKNHHQNQNHRTILGQVSKNHKKKTMMILDDDESHDLILNKANNTASSSSYLGTTKTKLSSSLSSSKSTKVLRKLGNNTSTTNSNNKIINNFNHRHHHQFGGSGSTRTTENRLNLATTFSTTTTTTTAAAGGRDGRNDDDNDDDGDLSKLMSTKLVLSSEVGDKATTSTTSANMMMEDVSNENTGELIPVDWKKEHQKMDIMFEKQIQQQLEGLPPFQRPFGLKTSVVFFEHQTRGVQWLLQNEVNAPPNPFNKQRQLKDGTVATYDYLTRRRFHSSNNKPHPPIKGSILSDDMGLGKTLQTLTLILSNPPKNCRYGPPGEGRRPTMSFDGETTICTLIVCPKSVISNWISQAREFIERDFLKIVVYEGTPANRSDIIRSVQRNRVDILLSTYETITAEHNKERVDKSGRTLKGIHDVKFHRIVLDEAQQIRNGKSKTYKAIENTAHNSRYRLALSGTPFVNKPEDVMSLLSFIGLRPLGDPEVFKEFVSDPIKERRRAGLTRLRLACSYVVLRRTKGIVSTGMADKTIHVHSIDFPDGSIHKKVYESLYCACRVAIAASMKGSNVQMSASTHRSMFAMLMRVRQSCSSGSLVQAAHYVVASHLMHSMYDKNGNLTRDITPSDGERMLEILQNAKGADESRVDIKGCTSPKIKALLNTIDQMQPDEKAVVFSQWTSMLDLIGDALNNAGHHFTRIDGSMTITERTHALQSLKNNDNCRFILCSLKAAGVGINITRANVCFMMDPWWNDAIENQAIDRVHRVGQTRSVRVYRMIMKNSIEERMLKVQKAKATLGKGTLTKLSKEEEKVAKITGLKDLFEIDDFDTSESYGNSSTKDDWFDH